MHAVDLVGVWTRRADSAPSPGPTAQTNTFAAASMNEAADRRFWTSYDYAMVERDARAMRRAHIRSIVAAFAGKLWTSVRAA
jgi:hypothetical protein